MPDQERLNGDGLILESHYAETMNAVVLPYLKQRQTDITVSGDGGKPLFCSCFTAEEPKGTVLLLHGFTENAFKFSELIHSLLRSGYSAVAYDQRGHGRSWRDEKVQKELSLTHVRDFNEYVRDLEIVCDTVLSKMPKPWMIFAHSMGGAVTALFLERRPDVFAKAALCAPMIAPHRNNVPLFAVKAICRGAKLIGKGKQRIFLSKPYAGPEDFDTSCAASKERFDWYDRIKAENPAFHNNGPTYSWTLESMKVTAKILAPGAVEKIACPVRLYTAENDSSVLPEAQIQFMGRVKDGKRALVKGSRHEIYRSADAVLFPWWHEILEFFKA